MTLPAHGEINRYIAHKCRCYPCAAAYSAYLRHVRRMKAYGRWQPYVDAEPVRRHVRDLMEFGIGWQRQCALAGVSIGVVTRLLYAQGGHAPSVRIRTESAQKLLALRRDASLCAPYAPIDSTGTRRRIEALIRIGYPNVFLGERLGMDDRNLHRSRTLPRIAARTHLAMEKLYNELWNKDPEAFGISATSVKRARLMGERRGWPPPAAWDDDEIDDPNAKPSLDGGKRTRRQDALMEDAMHIAATHTRDRAVIAQRLEISEDYLDQVLTRADDGWTKLKEAA